MTKIKTSKVRIFLLISILMIIPLVSSDIFPTDYSEEMGLKKGTVIGWGLELKKQTTQEGDSDVTSYRLHFIDEGATLGVREDIFTNIVRELKSLHPTYIKFNEDGDIINADFTVNEDGGNYTFEGEVIRALPGSRIFFDIDTGVKVEVPDNTDLTSFPDLSEFFPEEIILKGENIQLPDDMELIDGELKIEDNGYYLEQGTLEYKQMLIDSDGVLIANSDADLSGYDGAWIKQTSSELGMQSIEGNSIQVEFLENHEILNTDTKDKLTINIENGDGLKFEERSDQGLVPEVIHKSSDNGETKIYNDKLEFSFKEDELSVSPPQGLENEDFLNKYQSVAIEIESDSSNINQKIRVNSYRQFAILSENDEELVTYNEYGLPISTKIEDNELQTLEQLREKYPELEFGIAEDSEFPEDMEESDFPAYLVYYTDLSLESHSDAVENLNKISYGNYLQAYSRPNSEIEIGRLLVDPSELESHSIKIRDVTNPLYRFQHEYEHQLDKLVMAEELTVIKNLNDPEITALFNKAEDEEINVLEETSKIYYEKYPEAMLHQKYNEIAIEAIEKLDETTNPLFNVLKENDDYVSALTGIPYAYSLENYNENKDASSSFYLELSSTYREQPIETRRMNVQSSNPTTSEIYTKLTQLAFDSGKMDIDEYKEIMGEDYCYDPDCLDRLCSEYKLLCCEEHPNSINC